MCEMTYSKLQCAKSSLGAAVVRPLRIRAQTTEFESRRWKKNFHPRTWRTNALIKTSLQLTVTGFLWVFFLFSFYIRRVRFLAWEGKISLCRSRFDRGLPTWWPLSKQSSHSLIFARLKSLASYSTMRRHIEWHFIRTYNGKFTFRNWKC